MKKWIILLLPLLFLSAFYGKAPEKQTVSYNILESDDVAALDYRKPKVDIISDIKSFQSYYMRLHSNQVPKPKAPSVIFPKNRVLFVSFGKQNSAGYSIELLNVYIRNDVLIAEAQLLSPFKDDFQAQVITHPYLLITVPKEGYKRVELRNSKGETLTSAVP
ncbi:MAG: protease complex subunit PrcB family protein [Spirochaetota bacterium]|nr:MAG: protease complex subunit PrcB family protein [Spirochaetota bacterium]